MTAHSWPSVLSGLLSRRELSPAETGWAMREIMAGQATDAQLASFAVLLRAKGETPGEMEGLVEAMLANARRLSLEFDCVDVVGTGGDGAHTVNISTMASIVVAAAGVPVVKHGNRAASSKSGSADLLEALGIPLTLGPEHVERCVREAGIGFCFAAAFHPGMRHAAAPRREMGIPTAFNFLGPLTNPAQPRAGAIGCADERMAPVMARVLADRGASALVVRGVDGLDELTLAAPTRVWVVSGGEVLATEVDAVDLGLDRAPVAALRGGDSAYNAEVAREVFAGKPGAVRDAVILNAAAALAAFDGLDGLDGGISSDVDAALSRGLGRAREAIDSGGCAEILTRWSAVARG